ncbi:sigma-70 family RNA polymerase sigma factor [Chitinophaga pendula]|uniref:RNA polymerase sigma factor n=1 Tax=Chitinophaga TaxID=79328 RepID=UPI0012FE1BD7|nr:MULTISPECIES: sigma-70 family RNA polymerase sigma factor [Chitinophaga]UCJ08795.1 sigma-70 family RNA polymerase sigma factor [Chitinophaga pendula]
MTTSEYYNNTGQPEHVNNDQQTPVDELTHGWQEFQRHNERGLYKIYHHLFDNLYHYGISVIQDKTLIKEAINDVFVELWQKRDRLQIPDNIRNYIFICFKRRLYKALKKQPTHTSHIDNPLFPEPTVAPYETVLIQLETDAQLRLRMENILALLTSRQKEFIRLRFYENMSMEEISLKTSASVRTIYNTLHNALSLIRNTISIPIWTLLTLSWYFWEFIRSLW